MNSFYSLGVVPEVKVLLENGETLTVTNADVTIEIEQETIDHYSIGSDGVRARSRMVMSESKKVKIQVGSLEPEELMRLIRDE